MNDQDPDARRARLLSAKLVALVRDHVGEAELDGHPTSERGSFGPGAALLANQVAWTLLDDANAPGLGGCLGWAIRNDAHSLGVIADHAAAGIMARQAREFAFPITVFAVDGRRLVPVDPAPRPAVTPVAEGHRGLEAMIGDGGAVPVEEHGVLAGEVRGLEVCRVVDDDSGTARLAVGVGAHDRDAFAMLHADTPTVESLQRVVATVDQHRRDGAAPHPLNRLARERLLRDRALTEPTRIGAATLRLVAPPVPRANLRDAVPAVAVGRDQHGEPLVAVFSVGVDVELVPFAADARAGWRDGPQTPRLVLVTPARDQVRLTGELAALLTVPASLVTLDVSGSGSG